MDILVNNKKFAVFEYDDDLTILERYSLQFKDHPLSSFFRITDK
jgi:hypothetical protein